MYLEFINSVEYERKFSLVTGHKYLTTMWDLRKVFLTWQQCNCNAGLSNCLHTTIISNSVQHTNMAMLMVCLNCPYRKYSKKV